MNHEIFFYPVQIAPRDIDRMGHVNNVSYVGWMQDAAVAHSTANGWDWNRYLEYGAAFVARAHAIEYLLPVRETDQIQVKTWVAGMKRVSSTRRYEIVLNGSEKVVAKAETRWAFVDIQTGKPQKIPSELIDCFVILQDSLDRYGMQQPQDD